MMGVDRGLSKWFTRVWSWMTGVDRGLSKWFTWVWSWMTSGDQGLSNFHWDLELDDRFGPRTVKVVH